MLNTLEKLKQELSQQGLIKESNNVGNLIDTYIKKAENKTLEGPNGVTWRNAKTDELNSFQKQLVEKGQQVAWISENGRVAIVPKGNTPWGSSKAESEKSTSVNSLEQEESAKTPEKSWFKQLLDALN